MAIRPIKQQTITKAKEIEKGEPSGPPSRSRRRLRVWITGCLGVLVLGSTGCGSVTTGVDRALSDLNECIDDSMVDYRNRALAEKAWIRVRHAYAHRQYHRDFKDGFISGYMEVAAGGNGCTPAMAPSQYWGWKYQSPYGVAAVNAWFEGFPLGAKAAEQDGVGNWQSIRMNLRQPAPMNIPESEYDAAKGTNSPVSSDGQVLPVPQSDAELIEPQLDMSPAGRSWETEINFDDAEIVDPDSVFLEPATRGRRNDPGQGPAAKADMEVASRQDNASSTELFVPNKNSQGFSDTFVNDLFGSPASNDAGAEADDLPFNFE